MLEKDDSLEEDTKLAADKMWRASQDNHTKNKVLILAVPVYPQEVPHVLGSAWILSRVSTPGCTMMTRRR